MPQFARRIEGEGQSAAHKFAMEIFSALLAWLLVFTALAMIAMPWLIYVIAPGFSQDAQKLQLTIDLTRICFPYLLFMSLTALQSGVLNSLNRFTAAAAAPILLNIVMIGSNVLAWALGTGNSAATGYIFAWGVSLAGVAQFVLLAMPARAGGCRFFPTGPHFRRNGQKFLLFQLPRINLRRNLPINLLIATIIPEPEGQWPILYADRFSIALVSWRCHGVVRCQLSRNFGGDNQAALTSKPGA